MHAILQALDVEFILGLLNGKKFLDLYLLLMEIIYHCGMLTMIKIHLSQIFHHLEDGLHLGLSNMTETSIFAICLLIKISLHMHELDIETYRILHQLDI
jgi:hypothetical protein